MSSAAMELLDDNWRLIFSEYLDLIEAVRCRLVSKRLRFLIDQVHPTELLFYAVWHPEIIMQSVQSVPQTVTCAHLLFSPAGSSWVSGERYYQW